MARFYEKPEDEKQLIDLEFLNDDTDENAAIFDSNEVTQHIHEMNQRPAE